MAGRVFLVRRGRTALNAAGRLRSHLDPPFDDVGQDEAPAVAAALWEWRIVKILSSPLLRALQTAGAIAEAVGVPVTAVDDLIDRDYGRWSGELEAAVVARFGSLDAAPGVEPQGQSPSAASPCSKPSRQPSSTAM
jgi:broad specificity phosphatase PhoE